MNQREKDAVWSEGYQAAMRSIMRDTIKNLPFGDKEAAVLVVERGECVAALRKVCELHGDNDWSPDLHLADVIEKHLGNHLGY